MGAESHPERGEFRKVLKRPHHSRICNRNLEGGTMPHTLEAQPTTGEPSVSPLAGKPAPKEMLIDVARLERDYFERKPDVSDRTQLVAFGTSGHRGSSLHGAFNEEHILAITQAICEYRRGQGIDGPLYMGKDTHALSVPAQRTALEVLAANGAATTHQEDFVLPYVRDLKNVVDIDAIRGARLKLGVDPLGGAARPYWEPINSIYGLDVVVTNPTIDPTFSFMTVDHDGKIRMDCSSPYAMTRLVGLKDQYQVAFANDPDSDRHGIVTPMAGLMNPNHYLAVAIQYLFTHRSHWRRDAAVGKTLVSSSMIDKVVRKLGRELREVPVGFKWFVPGLLDGSYGFGGEESAGASFLRLDGTVWTTDKDGPIMDLLAAEITARTGKDPGAHYRELTAEFGTPHYTRIDAPATPKQKTQLQKLSPDDVKESDLAGEPITAKLTRAPGNNAPIGGLKVVAASGWFAARPSGTEDIYKIYAESFKSQAHLNAIVNEAQEMVNNARGSSAALPQDSASQ